MSALKRLNVIAKEIAKDETSLKPAMEYKEKKKFKHGNNIIMKTGTYRKYYGYVQDFLPAKVEVEIEEQQYIDASIYGNKNIGNTITTEFGESTIIDKKPKTFLISQKDESQKVQLQLNKEDIIEIIQYKKNNILRFGLVINSYSNSIIYKQIKLEYSEKSSKESLINEVSRRIKNDDFYTGDEQQIKNSDVILPELFFIKKGEYAGNFIEDFKIIPDQYLITYKKKIELNKSQIQRKTSNLYEIISGPYKGKISELIKLYPARLNVYLDAANKKVTKHMVKENNQYIERFIYPSDVFYIDITLNNGNLFEVKEITDNNTIIGLEMTKNGLIPRQISKTDIRSLQPGFSFSKDVKEKIELEENVYSYGEPEYDENELVTEEESELVEIEEPDESEPVEMEEVEMEEIQEQIEEIPETEFKASYKDIERITFRGEQLTQTQQKIKNQIKKITDIFNINTLNEFKLLGDIQKSFKIIKKNLKNKNISFWNVSDEKYIIASIVLFEIIKLGFGSMISNFGEDVITSYIKNLVIRSRPFFSKKDYSNSIFSKSGWAESFNANKNIFKALVSSKDEIEIHKYLIKNCISVLEEFLGKVDLEIKLKAPTEFISLGKRKYEDEPKTRITIKDIFTENVTKDANTILWGIAYQPLLEKYKNKLIETINNPISNETTKLIYDFVLENLENGMFILPEIKVLAEYDNLKYTKLSQIWENLLKDAKKIFDKKKSSNMEPTKKPSNSISIEDIIRQDVDINSNYIFWSEEYLSLLNKYKNKLNEKINDPKSGNTTKNVYKYIFENIETGFFAVPELKMLSKLNMLKYEKLSEIWENLLKYAKKIYDKLETEKEKKIIQLEKEKQELKMKRETISATKKLKSIGLTEDEEEESVELSYERKLPEYLERIAKKHKF